MNVTSSLPTLQGVTTLSGTPQEVSHRLQQLNAEHVVALSIEHGSLDARRAVDVALDNLAPLLESILSLREAKALESIVDALLPQIPLPKQTLIEARMKVQARKAVLESATWLTAAQVAELAGFSASNPSAQLYKWKKERRIFAIRHQGGDYFPEYALNPADNYRPYKALREILNLFNDTKDGWGAAYWFGSVNGFLGGKRPQDLLSVQPERVIAAAQDEMEGVIHG